MWLIYWKFDQFDIGQNCLPDQVLRGRNSVGITRSMS